MTDGRTLEIKHCKACNRSIYFVSDDLGTIQCLDATAPVWVQIRDQNGESRVMRVTGYVSHFSTCPQANDFSRSKKKEEEEKK